LRSGDKDAFNARLDRLHYVVGALKREGIYVYLGHLWWHTSTQVSEKDGFPGYGNGKTAFALLYFDPKGREWYESWVSALMGAKNPYTGLPMAQDPAVASSRSRTRVPSSSGRSARSKSSRRRGT